ncbi:MAG: TonB-dependent hemoglobin/transferrin/lactoferrin family receptor [Verrucomicrobiota bacterium]
MRSGIIKCFYPAFVFIVIGKLSIATSRAMDAGLKDDMDSSEIENKEYQLIQTIQKDSGSAEEHEVDAEVTVVSQRRKKKTHDVPVMVTVMTRKDMERNGVQNFGDVVKYEPLVSAPFDFATSDSAFAYSQSGFSSYNIRGIEGNRVLLTVDGIRQAPSYLSNSFDQTAEAPGGSGRDFFDPAMFEAVEIIKGPASSLYGSDALGGVVAFRTPDPQDLLSTTDNPFAVLQRVQYFEANESKANLTLAAVEQGPVAFLFGYAGRFGGETENNGDLPPNPAEFYSHSFLSKIDYQINESNFLQLTAEYYEKQNDIEVDSAEGGGLILWEDVFNTDYKERYRLSLDYELSLIDFPVFDEFKLTPYYQFSFNQAINESRGPDVFNSGGIFVAPGRVRDQEIEYDTEIYGADLQFDKQILGNVLDHYLIYGTQFSISNQENRFFREDTSVSVAGNRISFAPSDTYRLGAFIQHEFSLGEEREWVLTPAFRLDYYEVKSFTDGSYEERLSNLNFTEIAQFEGYDDLSFAPKFTVLRHLNESLNVYAAYARGIRNPTAEELTYIFDHPPAGGAPAGNLVIPNTELEEEKSDSFEIGLKGDYDPLSFELAAFYNIYDNFLANQEDTGLDTDDGRNILQTVNIGEVDIYGFEVNAQLRPGEISEDLEALKGVELGVATGWAEGRNKSEDQWLNTIDPFKVVWYAEFVEPDQERFGTRLTTTFVEKKTKIDETTSQGSFFQPGDFFVLDWSAFVTPWEYFTLSAGVNNLLDREYYLWSVIRRGGGHQGGGVAATRVTQPGRNFYISAKLEF